MENKEKLTAKEIEEIEMLIDKAITAANKKIAESFIKRLDFMRRTLDLEPNKGHIYG